MKEFLGGIALTILLGYPSTWIAWWGIVLVGVLVGFAIHQYPSIAFGSGFIGGGLFFGIYAYWLDRQNGSQLSAMMTDVLQFDPFLATILLGALLAAMGTLTGKYARDLLLGERKVARYRGKYR